MSHNMKNIVHLFIIHVHMWIIHMEKTDLPYRTTCQPIDPTQCSSKCLKTCPTQTQILFQQKKHSRYTIYAIKNIFFEFLLPCSSGSNQNPSYNGSSELSMVVSNTRYNLLIFQFQLWIIFRTITTDSHVINILKRNRCTVRYIR